MTNKINACKTCNGTGIEYDGAGHTCTSCNGIAATVVERQPVAFIQIPKNVEKYGHGDDPDRLKFGKPGQFFADGKSPMFDFVLLYTAPPELAELQATIARLTAERDQLKSLVEGKQGSLGKMFELKEKYRLELERLKGGQGEPRLVSYATDMSTCTLTLGDDTSYIYDRVCTPVPVGFVAHRLDEIGQSYEGVIYAPAILEGLVKQGTLLYTRDNSTSPTEDKS
jgi:hypothetical protein